MKYFEEDTRSMEQKDIYNRKMFRPAPDDIRSWYWNGSEWTPLDFYESKVFDLERVN